METLNSSGTFTEISSPRLLVHLHLSRFSGTLRISRGAFLKLLYFQTGEIAMASSNDQGDHLAPILMKAGKLKSEQLDLARKQTGPGTSLARILVQMGFLTSGELFAGARQQLRQIVGSVLSLSDGRYEILGDYFPREITSLNVDTRELLLDLIGELPDRSFVLLEVGAPDSVYRPVLSADGASVPLPKAWRDHADRFSRAMTIRAFGQSAGLDDFAASKTVYGLHLFGLLETPPAEPEAVRVPVTVSAGEPGAVEEEPSPGSQDIQLPGGTYPGASAISTGPGPVEQAVDETPPEPIAAPEIAAPIDAAPTIESAAQGEPTADEPDASWPVSGRPAAGEEIVARGRPIRLEFKDTSLPATPATHASGPWGILSIIAGIAILAFAFTWFVFLRGTPAPGGVSPATQGEAGEAPSGPGAEEESGQSPDAAETGAEPTAPAAAPPDGGTEQPSAVEGKKVTPAPAEVGSAPVKDAAAEENPGTGPGDAREPADTEAALRPVSQEPPRDRDSRSIAAIPPFAAAGRFFEARARLDAGDAVAASAAWLEMVREETGKIFTLQIAIACQEESVKKAASRTRGSPEFFTVPFLLQGKSCYRLCWGAYATEPEAQAGKPTVPAFFFSDGGKPVVVRLSRLAPPEKP